MELSRRHFIILDLVVLRRKREEGEEGEGGVGEEKRDTQTRKRNAGAHTRSTKEATSERLSPALSRSLALSDACAAPTG
jgi:hypothetical protein